MIRNAAGSYDKYRVDQLSITHEHIQNAIKRSRDSYQAGEKIPNQPQTAVHLIIESLVEKNIITVRGDRESDAAVAKKKSRSRKK